MKDQAQKLNQKRSSIAIQRLAAAIAMLNITAAVLFAFLQLAAGYDDGLAGLTLLLNAIVYSVLGALIISREPRQVIGWLFLLTGFVTALNMFPEDRLIQTSQAGLLRILVLAVGNNVYIPAYLIPLTLILQFFPDGSLPSPRWRPLTVITIVALIGSVVGGTIGTLQTEGLLDPQTGAPFSEVLSALITLSLVISIFGSLAAVVVRFYHAKGIERAQMKWLVYTVVLWVPAIVLSVFLTDGEGEISAFFILSYPTVLSLAIGIAVLRHRLFDIDIIIRRTLQYGLLTAVLVAVYFGVVLLAQSAFVALTGQESPLAIVLSTLLIAALFNPLRRRIQAFIDQRFYRKRYDAAQTLEQFARLARDEVNLGMILQALDTAVQDSLQPHSVAIWLKEEGGVHER